MRLLAGSSNHPCLTILVKILIEVVSVPPCIPGLLPLGLLDLGLLVCLGRLSGKDHEAELDLRALGEVLVEEEIEVEEWVALKDATEK